MRFCDVDDIVSLTNALSNLTKTTAKLKATNDSFPNGGISSSIRGNTDVMERMHSIIIKLLEKTHDNSVSSTDTKKSEELTKVDRDERVEDLLCR